MARKSEDSKSAPAMGLLDLTANYSPVDMSAMNGGLLGSQLQNGPQTAAAEGMNYLQLPTADAAKQKLIELQGLGFKGYLDPYGNDIYGHEIRFWKDPNMPSMNPNKPSGK